MMTGPSDAAVRGHSRLVEAPLDPGAATATLSDAAGAEAGAVVAFTGVVRADPGDAGRVTHLAFEAYPEMAAAELERVRVEAAQRFPLLGCIIEHRIGTLAVGTPIVVVVTAAAHRADAFAAAAWAMDTIKARVPIWKAERHDDGSERWAGPTRAPAGSAAARADEGQKIRK